MFSTIVHPTDFSESTRPALQAAHHLAKELRCRLVICFITHPPLVARGDEVIDPKTDESRNVLAELESLAPKDPHVNRELQVVVVDQSTGVKGLLAVIERPDCDLLVLGMHKRSGVAGWFSSSITEEVVRRAKTAVLVVKHQAEEAGPEEAGAE